MSRMTNRSCSCICPTPPSRSASRSGSPATLSRHGEVFLDTVFPDGHDLAHAVNQLLVIGFYLVNLGWACPAREGRRRGHEPDRSDRAAVDKLGILLLLLGAAHLMNLYVFHRIKKGAAA